MASCMQQLYMMPQARAAILNSRVCSLALIKVHCCIEAYVSASSHSQLKSMMHVQQFTFK